MIRVEGSVFGLRLSIVERVTERDPPHRKVWETTEDPRRLVFGNYRLDFEMVPKGTGSRVQVSIHYDLPRTSLGRLLGPLGARKRALVPNSYAGRGKRHAVVQARPLSIASYSQTSSRKTCASQ